MMTTPIAFTAYSNKEADCDQGAVVQFNSIVTNVGGFYDENSSIFTVPTDGLYLFSASVRTAQSTQSMWSGISHEGRILVDQYSSGNGNDQGSSIALVECVAFDNVWVECRGDNREIAGERVSSFSGVLILPYA